jgi:hypothetical protein
VIERLTDAFFSIVSVRTTFSVHTPVSHASLSPMSPT